MKENLIKIKSFAFAIRIVNLYRFLQSEKKEYVISKQLLKSGTSVGACIRESENAESRNDFKHKLSIAQKEINETIYWLELLISTNYINNEQFASLNKDATQIMKLLTSILRSIKKTNSEQSIINN
ncbi:MAG TPA: four helix bundle protein [Puia sp.]|jgi:four helix bundle protein|nr:four helix bundle protein [Puia sp.]